MTTHRRPAGRSPHGRPFHRGQRGSRTNGFQRRSPRRFGSYIDPALFINKAVVTETVVEYVPEHAFADFVLEPELKTRIAEKGYVVPTPIQDRAIPHVLKGGDVVGIANTGTGKTAAFLIPIINKLILDRRSSALVMVPTRELALQINEEFRSLVPGLRLFSATFVGGTSTYRDVQKLRQHNHLIIGTPGRLKDMAERGALQLEDFSTVVLDEADRMLDMGFIHDMRVLLARVPESAQGLFFSATLSRSIEALVSDFLTDPVTISVKTQETSSSVEQDVIRVPPGALKIDILTDLLKNPEFDKVLVFGETKHGVEKLAKELMRRGINAESIHGNKTHGKRQNALRMFKDAHAQVLVATDVAARGLDIAGVSHVINYDIPHTYEDYVHRIGRTGRAGKRGKALTFVGA
ncbi:DEAD/DEAH box helicase [Patescibacteria group bacterium]|nr:DEAD/DEAH box helicase [Patescibacteria group bacterium]